MLHVRSANEAPTHPQTYSPFVVTAGGVGGGDGDGGHLSTLSAYETVHDLTPSSADDIFTRIWEPHMEVDVSPAMPLPTQTTTTTHRRQHHHHHQQQQQQQQRPQFKTTKLDEQHKLIYINATNFDGNPSLTLPDSSSEGASIGSELDTGLINLEYITPPKKYGEITTAPSRGFGSGIGVGGGANAKYPPMPNFPPPRTTMLSTTVAPVAQFFTPPHHHLVHHGHDITASSSNSNNMNNNPLTTHGYQLVETQSTFPLQTASPNYQQPTQMFTPQQSGVQTMTPMDVYQQQHQQQRNQLQTYPPHQFINQQQQQQRHSISSVTAVTTGGKMSLPTSLSPQPTRMAQVPIRKGEP